MKKFILLAILAVTAVGSCHAQQTPIQATVTDPSGNPYAFLTGSTSINCPGNQQPTYNGFTVPRNYSITGGDGNGHFTQVLYDVNLIQPTGCSYNFAITYKDGITSFTATGIGASGSSTPITGSATVNLSVPISAYAVPLPNSGGGVGSASNGQSLVNVSAAVVGANTLTWNRLGGVIGTPFQGGGTIGQQEPSAFVQTSPQVLSSAYPQVVGMLYTCNSFNICYAEAPHPEGPFTPYPGNPVISTSGCASNVLTLGGQLVMFGCASRTDIHRYHSTTNGISWVDDGAVVTHGASWTTYSVDNSSILVIGGVCYLWFDGGMSATVFGQGLTTGNSTCAVGSFTEHAGDPAIPSSELNGGAPFVYYDGTNFWNWELGGATTANAYPSYLYFTELNPNGFGTPAPHVHTQILLPRFDDEGGGQTGVEVQEADPFAFEWPYAQGDPRNTTYLYYSSCAQNCNAPTLQQFTIKVASIPMPMSKIVKIPQADQAIESDHSGWQFVNGISSVNPLPVPTMFDNANRPNSTNLGNDWTALSGNFQAAIVSNQFEESAPTTAARPLYARVQPNADQFSAVQIIAAASTSNVGAIVRGSPTVASFYECVTQGALGSSQTIIIRKYVNGAGFTTVATQTGTPHANDWMVFTAQGSTLTCVIYDPAGNITVSGTDTSVHTGLPGFSIGDTAAQGNAILDNWSGGSIYGDGSAATQQSQYWIQSQIFASITSATVTGSQSYAETTAPSAASGSDVVYGDSTAHCIKASLNNGSFICLAQVTAVPLTVGSSTGNVFVAPNGYFICTAACTVTPPLPTAGVKFCIQNDVNTTGAITLGALGGAGAYGNQANTAYGTAGTGTLSSAGAATDSVCIEGRDTSHYVITYHVGTWTAS